MLEYLETLDKENKIECPSLLRDMNELYDLAAKIEETLLGQVWDLGAHIRVHELFAIGVDLNRFKEYYKKYENFEEKLSMNGIFAVYKRVLSLNVIKDKSEVDPIA